jgi:hypothetical protein
MGVTYIKGEFDDLDEDMQTINAFILTLCILLHSLLIFLSIGQAVALDSDNTRIASSDSFAPCVSPPLRSMSTSTATAIKSARP